MGIRKPIEEYEKHVLSSLGWAYRGLKWCELGNQRNYENRVAKEIYENYGVQHVSIDLNGKDGALPIDLGQPVPFIFINQFDVITNYGTIEHVNDQFQAFKNMHEMCKEGGIMINVFPLMGNWPKHCRYYYSEKFVNGLANATGYCIFKYTILDESFYKAPRNVIAMTYIKQKNMFITKEEFNRIGGLKDTGNLMHMGNYTI